MTSIGSPVAPEQGRSPRRRIVIVEDNDDARESLRYLMEDLGHQVETAPDGVAGRDLILATRPEIAFIDVGLPLLDGYQVAEQLRTAADLADTCLVALTGYGGPEAQTRAMQAGFDQQLTKPITLEEIDRVLSSKTSAGHTIRTARIG